MALKMYTELWLIWLVGPFFEICFAIYNIGLYNFIESFELLQKALPQIYSIVFVIVIFSI